jgi:16S rRNA processing protein RimM
VKEFYLVAKIVSAFGRDGFVKVSSFTDFPDHLLNLKKVYIDFFGDKKEFLVDDAKETNGSFLFKFRNFDNEKEIEILLDKEIFVDDKDLIKLPENSYFIHDLIGSRVLRNNVEIGKVKNVVSFPANDVYVVENEQGEEILIPAVHDFIEGFDPAEKLLKLKPGEKLYEDDED